MNKDNADQQYSAPGKGLPQEYLDLSQEIGADVPFHVNAPEATEQDAMALALMERLGPHALTGGKMSLIEAFEHGWQAARQARPCVQIWANTAKRLPAEYTEVLLLRNGKVQHGYWFEHSNGNRHWCIDGLSAFYMPEPTHWMRLPQPPSVGVQSNDSDRKE